LTSTPLSRANFSARWALSSLNKVTISPEQTEFNFLCEEIL
jgi:hypothetical protein